MFSSSEKSKLLSNKSSYHSVPRRELLNTALVASFAAALSPNKLFGLSSEKAGEFLKNSDDLMLWSQYLKLLEPAGDLVRDIFDPDDAQLRAELYRQLTMNLSSGYFLYFQSNANFPDWMPFLNSVFMLQPNPDDTYWLSHLDDGGTYRIVGNRGSVRILSFVLLRYISGATDDFSELVVKEAAEGVPSKIPNELGFYDADDLAINQNGSFEVIISPERPADYQGDWWPLRRGTTCILARQRSYDWGNEQDARFAIERLDRSFSGQVFLKPRMTANEIDINLKKIMGGYVRRLSQTWLNYQTTVRDRGLINRAELAAFGGSLPAQTYWQSIYELSDDEAIIIETDVPQQNRYWNVQICDELWNAAEFIYRQSSLNGYQARLDSDGKFRAIVSVKDPGIWNWLDTAGYLRGMIIGRWYEADSNPVPTIKKIPFQEINQHLTLDTLRITPDQRQAQLRARIIGGQLRRRW